MFERFNNNFQNIQPEQDPNIDPYKQQYFGENDSTPYIENMSIPVPGGLDQNNFYPLEPSLATPSLSTQINPNGNARNNYAKGGKVKRKSRNLLSLAEQIRRQGGGDDKILAHINPYEAQLLQENFGGDINPQTGLPQYGKLWKKIRNHLGGVGGAILGNLILPGVGGIAGGALGQGAQHAARGKSPLKGALEGLGMGAAIPSVAGLAGSGANALGMNTAGNFLSNYGERNAIFPSINKLFGSNLGGGNALINGTSAGETFSSRAGGANIGDLVPTVKSNAGTLGTVGNGVEKSFLDTLGDKSKDFLTDPKSLLTLGVLGSSFLNRPKEKSPEQLAAEHKRYNMALLLSPEEQAKAEAAELAGLQSKRRNEKRKFLPEERLNVDPVYRKNHSPEEYEKTKRYFSYYNNPGFSGNPLPYKKGGSVPRIEYEVEEMQYPQGLGSYIKGETGGQDDKIKALLSDGEFVIPADVVSHAGDGNNESGAQKFYDLIKNIRKHKGGSVKLPPKAKSLASYMR